MNIIFNIWMQPIYGRLNLDSRKSLYILMSLFPVASQIIASMIFFRAGRGDSAIFIQLFLISLAALTAIVAFTWYFMLSQNIRLQYSPARARLIPNIRAYLQTAMMLPAMLCACATYLIEGLVFHQFAIWSSITCVCGLLSITLLIRTNWAGLFMVFSFQIPAISQRIKFDAVNLILNGNLALPAGFIFLSLLLFLIYACAVWTFSSNVDSLSKKHEIARLIQQSMAGRKMNENRASISLAFVFLSWMRFYVTSAMRNVNPLTRNVKLIGFTLGPRIHWTTTLLQVLAMVILGSSAMFLLNLLIAPRAISFMKFFTTTTMGMLFISLPLFFFLVFFYTLFQTRVEQALVSLTEKSMSNALQDKTLTNYLLRQFLILYSLSATAAFFIGKFALDSDTKIASLALYVCCLFPLILSIVRNHGQMRTVNDHPMIKNLLLCLLIFAIGMVFVLGAPRIAIFWYCALVFVSTLALLFFKMKANARIRIFPVGRAA